MARQKQKQKQNQNQKVIVNIGNQVIKRKKRKIGTRKAPFLQQRNQLNIQPIVLPQTDYGPLILAMMEQNKSQNQTKNLNVPSLLENNPTPLSLSSPPPASLMAGLAAERRAGPTADKFQPLPSQADKGFSMPREDERSPKAEVPTPTPQQRGMGLNSIVRPPDPVFTERLVKSNLPDRSLLPSQSPPPPLAESRPLVGRPRKDITRATKEGEPEQELVEADKVVIQKKIKVKKKKQGKE